MFRAALAGALAAAGAAATVAAQGSEFYDQPPATVLGCKCKRPCVTSLAFQCAAAPLCSVESADCEKGRAQWSLSHGHYDYCVYEPFMKYEELAASAKQSMLLDAIGGDRTSGSFPSYLELAGIFKESMMTSFDAVSDVFPQPREKYIHSVGVAGGIKFESSGVHPYTGIFKGSEHGLLRLSIAKTPGPMFTPGAALKFLRDGRPSANFVAMPSLDGQSCSESNFFAWDFSTHVVTPADWAIKLIAKKFWQASYCPQMVGLSDVASEASQSESESVFPWQLVLHPLLDVQCSCESYTTSCLGNLAAVKVGTPLFEVRAVSEPGATFEVIGRITLTSELQTSKFGDESLFFRHQRMEEDFAVKPDWLKMIDLKAQCGMSCAGKAAPLISKGCKSPFNDKEQALMLADDVVITVR